MINKIHIWNLPLDKVYIKLNKVRKELINESIKESDKIISGKFRRKAGKLIKFLNNKSIKYNTKQIKSDRIIFHWKKGDCFIPLWAITEMSKLAKCFPIGKIEKAIIFYKAKSGSYIVKSKFPLEINPEMVALYFHLFGDGSFSEKNSTAVYSQLDKKTRNNFIKKLECAFGKFNSSKIKGSKYSFVFPSIFANILKHTFNVNTFLSDRGRIPKKIKELPNILKFSGVIAFLIDEGYIGDNITFSSSNKLFLKDFGELLLSIGFDSKISNNILTLKNNDIPKFYENYLKLISISPYCNLTFKEDRLKLLYNVNKRSRGHNFTKEIIKNYQNKILQLLEYNKLKTNDIRLALFNEYNITISYTTLRRLLRSLEREKLIKKRNIIKSKYEWFCIY
tara:strand:- start:1683 stop:2861 length:1179 start_codon:yes stop_codon:yes gene_type:complete